MWAGETPHSPSPRWRAPWVNSCWERANWLQWGTMRLGDMVGGINGLGRGGSDVDTVLIYKVLKIIKKSFEFLTHSVEWQGKIKSKTPRLPFPNLLSVPMFSFLWQKPCVSLSWWRLPWDLFGTPSTIICLPCFTGHDSIYVSKQGEEEACILMRYNFPVLNFSDLFLLLV